VSSENGRLYFDITEGERTELFAETPTQFFIKNRPWTLNFVREGKQPIRLDIHYKGGVSSGPKVN